MRALSTSALSVLVVLALFWGNCFSCPQLLLLVTQQHQAPHGCCKRPVPVERTCQNLSLKNFVKADPAKITPPAASVIAALPLPAAAVPAEPSSTTEIPYSPPDRQALHSTFRI